MTVHYADLLKKADENEKKANDVVGSIAVQSVKNQQLKGVAYTVDQRHYPDEREKW